MARGKGSGGTNSARVDTAQPEFPSGNSTRTHANESSPLQHILPAAPRANPRHRGTLRAASELTQLTDRLDVIIAEFMSSLRDSCVWAAYPGLTPRAFLFRRFAAGVRGGGGIFSRAEKPLGQGELLEAALVASTL